MTDTTVLEALYQYKQQAMACALVIVVDCRGSVPAWPEAKMLVPEDWHTVNLRAAGFSDADLSRIQTPVGLDIGAKTPQEIGFSIVGQLISQRRQDGSKNRDHSAGRGSLGPDGPDQAAFPCAG